MNACAAVVVWALVAAQPGAGDAGRAGTTAPAIAAPTAPPPASTTVGIEGKVLYRYPGPLRARPVDDKAPVVLRIAAQGDDGGETLYDLRSIAQHAGEFDLRDCLERADGRPLTDAPAIPVRVAALLPDDHAGDLFEVGEVTPRRPWGYRMGLIAAGALWLAVPAYVLAKRLLRRRATPPAAPVHGPPTLADQLRPLVEAGLAGELSTPDRARLELLLLAYWRDRLGVHASPPSEAIAALRRHAEAGEVLELLERWLHQPAGTGVEPVDVPRLLARYRTAPAIQLHHPQGAAA